MKKILAVFALFLLSFGLFACDTPSVTKITFETNQGTPIDAIEFSDLYEINKLNQFSTTKEGYTFAGWYTAASLDESTKLVNDITESVTLYAKWSLVNYSITYHLDGGENVEANPNSITIEDTITLQNPTKSGFVFSGWYLDSAFTQLVTALPKGIKNNIDLYAKWSLDTSITYVITWQNEDGSVLKTESLVQGSMPAYVGSPTKADTETHTFTFKGWTPALTVVSANQTYVATYEMTSKFAGKAYDKTEINTIFGFDISALLPTVVSSDYVVIDLSDDTMFEVYVDLFDWTTTEYEAYSDLLDQTLAWDEVEESWVVGDYFVYSYEDTETYPGLTVFGFGVYGSKTQGGGDEEFSPDALNALFGFDIYATLPAFTTNNAALVDLSEGTTKEVYIDIFDWTNETASAYMDLLDTTLTYNATEEAWVLGNYFVYVFEDADTYPGQTVYGIGIYSASEQGGGGDGTEFEPIVLNTIFGFDIYALIPSIQSNDSEVFDESVGTDKEVYIDLFDWLAADADAYMTLLDAMLPYDEVEQSWILGSYFLYVYEDTETYPGETVYGIGIYGVEGEIVDPVEGVYFAFNIQNTTTTLTNSYKNTVNQTLAFPGSDSKVTVKVSHLAFISGSDTAPGGLTQGYIFASDIKGLANTQTYIEIDTLGTIIPSFSFEIEARDSYSTRLVGAKVQVWDGSNWIDLAGGNFYSQLSTDMVTITINNLNASKFRLLFVGSGDTSGNGGQFKVSNIQLFGSNTAPVLESWADMIAQLGLNLNEPTLNNLLPELEGLSGLSLVKVNNSEYTIRGAFAYADHQNRVNAYIQSLITKGYVLDSALSAIKGQNVYSLMINNDIAYAVYIVSDGTTLDLRIWKYDPVIEPANLATLTTRQTINEFEKATFGKSGLPSTGKYNVLVVPVEISGSLFPSNYQANLNLVFNGTSNQTGWESVSSYYYKSSYGKLDLTFDIAPKFTTANAKSYYQNYADEGDQHAIMEALVGLNPQIDFSQYDSNNDGLIDSIIFIYSVDYSDNDPWWAWVYAAQYGVADDLSLLDGKRFEYYFWASYDFINDALPGVTGLVVNAETFVHELGHLMGMPDLYPYNEDLAYGPVGGMDMMDNNAGDHGPFNKLVFGWLQPLLGTQGSYQVTLDAYSTDTDGLNNTLLIPFNSNDLNDGNAFDEYLLIMFYTPNGLYNGHVGLPHVLDNAGIMIYHVDARMKSSTSFWGEYFLRNNNSTSNFFVQLLEADFNNSIPSPTSYISQSDILSSGSMNLSAYKWSNGTNINVMIEVAQSFTNSSSQAVINVTVS